MEALQARVADLESKFSDTQAIVPAEWGLTAMEERVFRVLLAVETVTRQAVAEGAGTPETRTIDVHIARIRKKVSRFGVDIESVRARGWRLVGRFTWARSLAARTA